MRGVIFDLDGTLIDGYEAITTAVNAARRAYELPPLPESDVRTRVGGGLLHLMDQVVGTEHREDAANIFRSVYDRICEELSHEIPGTSGVLRTLAGWGVRMSVASNKPAAYSERILGRLGMRSFFDAVSGPETAGALKPDPAMIDACRRAMGTSAAETLYVGDMAIDAEAARRARVAVTLVCGGSSSREELLATGSPVIGSLEDLPALVRRTGAPPD